MLAEGINASLEVYIHRILVRCTGNKGVWRGESIAYLSWKIFD